MGIGQFQFWASRDRSAGLGPVGLRSGSVAALAAGILAAGAGAFGAPTAKPVGDAIRSSLYTVQLTKDGATKFLAVGRPSALKINGEGSAPEGSIDIAKGQATGAISVDVASFKTGIETRDKHMKEKYFEVGKPENQKATLTIAECAVPGAFFDGASAAQTAVPFKGKLKLHGVEKDVVGTVDLKRDGDKVSADSKFEVKISDYGIAVPSFAGITVAENVTVNVALTGKTQPAADRAAASAPSAGNAKP